MGSLGLQGRTAVITGAGGGLGASHAKLLASYGVNIVVNDVHNAQSIVDEITAAGGRAVPDTNDVTTATGGAAIIERAVREFGSIDIVVNNAGVIRDKTFHRMTPEMIDIVLDVHLKGTFNVSQPAFIRMREAGYGRIVNTTSGAGLFGNFGQANYAAAKAGIVGLTRTLAIEGASSDIKVNVIAPMAYTAMTEKVMGPEAARTTSPELVSPVVALLAGSACPVTGEIISVGAGRVARVFIATARGYINPALSAEDVLEHWDEVVDSTDFICPTHAFEEPEKFNQTTMGMH